MFKALHHPLTYLSTTSDLTLHSHPTTQANCLCALSGPRALTLPSTRPSSHLSVTSRLILNAPSPQSLRLEESPLRPTLCLSLSTGAQRGLLWSSVSPLYGGPQVAAFSLCPHVASLYQHSPGITSSCQTSRPIRLEP